MPLSFLHFDSTQRENKSDGPFKSSFKLANSIRNVKKIYLKSAEIPCGYFNIRTPQTFSFMVSQYESSIYGVTTLDDFSRLATIAYTPVETTNYNLLVSDANNTSAQQNMSPYVPSPDSGDNPDNPPRPILQFEPVVLKILIPIGNYSIDSLLVYINSAINNLYLAFKPLFTILQTPPILSKVQVAASASFPVGYLQITHTAQITMLSNILGFVGTETKKLVITSTNLYNIYPDTCLYLYFPNIPHKNTHFNNQLISFKIPVTAGYQAIEFNQENVNFAQYIELHDSTFILNKIQLIVYDRQGNYIDNNNFDFTFTLGIETE